MNKRIFFSIILCILISGVTSCKKPDESQPANAIANLAPATEKKNFKPKMKGSNKAIKYYPNQRQVKVCFDLEFDESHPVYIIRPDKGNVSLKLDGRPAPCKLKAYKLNPKDDPANRLPGHLEEAIKKKKYCELFNLSDFFSEDELTAGKHTIEATFNWSTADPDLDQYGNCPKSENCYPILQGSINIPPQGFAIK